MEERFIKGLLTKVWAELGDQEGMADGPRTGDRRELEGAAQQELQI